MSFENKGTTPVTAFVTLDPDRSGNYVCSGVADDVEIQLAIDYVGFMGGGTVVLGRGTFDITAALVDNGYSDIWVKGQGKMGATKLDLTADDSMFNITAVTGWTISDMEIDCNDQGTGGDPGIVFDEVDDGLIHDVWVHHVDGSGSGSAYGIFVTSCLGTNVVRCKATDCDHAGIEIAGGSGGGSYYCNIIDCYGENNADSAAAAQAAHFVLIGPNGSNPIVGCNIINSVGIGSGNMGIQIYQYAFECSVISCYVDDYVNEGIALGRGAGSENTCRNLRALNNHVRCVSDPAGTPANVTAGISIYNPNCLVDGNTVEDFNSTIGNNGGLIYVDVGASDVVISNNMLYHKNGTYGIRCRGVNINVVGNTMLSIDTGNNFRAFYVIEPSGTTDSINIVGNTVNGFNRVVAFTGTPTNVSIKDNKFLNPSSDNVSWFVLGTDESYVATTFNQRVLHHVTSSTYLVADGGPFGSEIDATTEYAIYTGRVPPDCIRVAQLIITGTALVADADSMMLNITMYAGEDDLAYNTRTIGPVSKASYTGNFAANDNILWLLAWNDDNDLEKISEGETIGVKIQWNAASGDDVETDIVIKSVTIDYV